MKLRRWQSEAIPLVESHDYTGMVRAVMGAGKSICMSELIRRAPSDWTVLVTAPSIRLVEQLSGTVRSIVGEPVGQVYTHAHRIERITVVCHPSLEQLPIDHTPDLWIADEAHRTEQPVVLAWSAFSGCRRRLGFSATPWSSVQSRGISLFNRLIYSYDAASALRDGDVVVPWRIVHPDREGDADEVCLDMIQRETTGPGVVNATSIRDAEHYAHWLTERGVPAAAVHSDLSDSGRDALRRLESGDIRCVVHVNMLAEGVDLPWLRWLCLRRPSSNPVRFAQEVGRALRSCPGKTHADILDPHDLFGLYQLDAEAVLGAGEEGEKRASTPDIAAQQLRIEMDLWSPQVIPVEGIPRVRSYLRRVVTAMGAAGQVETIPVGPWRRRPASDRQLAYAERIRFSRAPSKHRDVLQKIAQRSAALTRGDVSDLITIQQGLRKGWPDLLDMYNDA